MKKKDKKRNKRFRIILLVVCTLIFLLLLFIIIGKWRISGTTIYRTTLGKCNSAEAYDNESGLNKKGECLKKGYYIDNKRVNVNIGSINCASNIEIMKIKVDKKMNVNIKVKEKKSKTQAKCMCKPSLNIIFTKKVNSVTVTTEDGIKLRQCN